ncbi:MAG TPA: DegT/DnrJ/EryC1/StrS aminotransferase family protein [Alphaproteobacteria bacterium]|nr:aminotransferase DegT [Rhodospirillaceae bacterium]HRJ11703.1 DegT/DnrJ/EryC1/StrS aminotransferase family protein [Alphaproteobacteria bacterium]
MIPFIDLATQQQRIKKEIDTAVLRVLDHGQYILGPEVREFEEKLANFCGAKYTVACANGTDAIALPLMLLNVKPGDAIFCPSFTFTATAEVVCWRAATPYFVDIDPRTYNMCAESLRAAILECQKENKLTPRGIIAVDLFGLPADYDALNEIAEEFGLWLIMDSAQGFGATYKNNRRTGSMGRFATTSFFPAKPLGCYGDGGAILTNNENDIEILHSLRVHGQGTDKYDNVRIGMNSRLDTLQAAILLEKLKIYEDEIVKRNVVAQRYTDALQDVVRTPHVPDEDVSIWAQYTIAIPDGARAGMQEHLKSRGIPTAIYYPRPLHLQPAYRHYPSVDGKLPHSEAVMHEVLSLPMHPYLMPEVQDGIIAAIKAFRS